MPSTSNSNRHPGGSSLMDLQPVDAGAFRRAASGWLVWGSLVLVWMASLLPWRLWQPSASRTRDCTRTANATDDSCARPSSSAGNLPKRFGRFEAAQAVGTR